MAKLTLPIYDLSGKSTENMDLNPAVFGLEPNGTLIHQAVTTHLSNRRSGIAHTKDRAEVRGGGRKPWRQKGTGNARAGSSRSPIWRGGGVTFGPRNERNFSLRMPQKMRQAALKMALSAKVNDEQLVIVSQLSSLDGKTKSWVKAYRQVPHTSEKALIVAKDSADVIERSIRNVVNQKFVSVEGLTLYDILRFPQLVMTKDSIEALTQRLAGSKGESNETPKKKTSKKEEVKAAV